MSRIGSYPANGHIFLSGSGRTDSGTDWPSHIYFIRNKPQKRKKKQKGKQRKNQNRMRTKREVEKQKGKTKEENQKAKNDLQRVSILRIISIHVLANR